MDSLGNFLFASLFFFKKWHTLRFSESAVRCLYITFRHGFTSAKKLVSAVNVLSFQIENHYPFSHQVNFRHASTSYAGFLAGISGYGTKSRSSTSVPVHFTNDLTFDNGVSDFVLDAVKKYQPENRVYRVQCLQLCTGTRQL